MNRVSGSSTREKENGKGRGNSGKERGDARMSVESMERGMIGMKVESAVVGFADWSWYRVGIGYRCGRRCRSG